MFPFLIKIKEIIFDILFPPICLNCQKHLNNRNGLICEKCLSLIKINNTLFCSVCRARLAENRKICHRGAPYFLAAAGNYDDPV
ncbi:MAG: double zinc ribbon domain-containing protein, partial [Patescibacteria group bacterium]